MKSKFLILCVALVAFFAFGYWYQQRFYPLGSDKLSLKVNADKEKICTELFEKIDNRPSCDGKLSEFKEHWSQCNDQKVTYRENIFSFNDYYFEIVDCFVAEGKDDKATALLKEIEKLPHWERVGPTNCSNTDEAKARIEALSFPDNTCIKESDLQSWVGTSPDLSEGLLKQITARNHTLSCGSYNSDDICFCPLQMIAKVTTEHRNLLVSEIETSENRSRKIHLVSAESGKEQLIVEMSEKNGCLFLSAVYSVASGSLTE